MISFFDAAFLLLTGDAATVSAARATFLGEANFTDFTASTFLTDAFFALLFTGAALTTFLAVTFFPFDSDLRTAPPVFKTFFIFTLDFFAIAFFLITFFFFAAILTSSWFL
jgi:hypothetical protein